MLCCKRFDKNVAGNDCLFVGWLSHWMRYVQKHKKIPIETTENPMTSNDLCQNTMKKETKFVVSV